MKARECIDRLDNLNPNQYSTEDKARWLSILDISIFIDVIKTHELNEGETVITEFVPYEANNLEREMLAPFPYDELYIAYLQMKVDEANKETSQYNNSAYMYNTYLDNYKGWYNRTHLPINTARYNMWRH